MTPDRLLNLDDRLRKELGDRFIEMLGSVRRTCAARAPKGSPRGEEVSEVMLLPEDAALLAELLGIDGECVSIWCRFKKVPK